MKYSIAIWMCGLALSWPMVLGCSDTSGGAAGSGGTLIGTGGSNILPVGGSGGGGGIGGAAPTKTEPTRRVPLRVRITERPTLPPGGETPLEGVELCETETDNCDTSDEDGIAMITLPENSEVSYTLTKDGYISYLVADVTDVDFRQTTFWPMLDQELYEFALAILGTFPPFDGGHLLVRSLKLGAGGMEGVSFELLSEAAPPFYQVAGTWAGTWDLKETTTTGQGGFVELTPGDHEVQLSGTCVPGLAWQGDAPNTIRVPVEEGFFSYASVICVSP